MDEALAVGPGRLSNCRRLGIGASYGSAELRCTSPCRHMSDEDRLLPISAHPLGAICTRAQAGPLYTNGSLCGRLPERWLPSFDQTARGARAVCPEAVG
jgi:hypothetical protein